MYYYNMYYDYLHQFMLKIMHIILHFTHGLIYKYVQYKL